MTKYLVKDEDLKAVPSNSENINDKKEESKQEGDKQETSTKMSRDWIVVKDHSLDNIL